MSELNPFKIAQAQLDEAASIMGLEPAVHELLRWPLREFHVTLPVRMDDGSVKIFHGFRVQYNDSRGPTKGGLRFHPDETIDTVRALAEDPDKTFTLHAPPALDNSGLLEFILPRFSLKTGVRITLAALMVPPASRLFNINELNISPA